MRNLSFDYVDVNEKKNELLAVTYCYNFHLTELLAELRALAITER